MIICPKKKDIPKQLPRAFYLFFGRNRFVLARAATFVFQKIISCCPLPWYLGSTGLAIENCIFIAHSVLLQHFATFYSNSK